MAKEKPKAPAAPPPAESAPKASRKGLLVKIGIVAGVLLIQTIGSYLLQKNLFFDSASPKVAEAHIEDEHGYAASPESLAVENPMQIVMMEEIVVNPANTAGRRYLAAVVGLQSSSPTIEAEVGDRVILIRDAVISLLSSKNLSELSSITYRDTLKYEIRDIVNKQLKSATVDNVVFSEYVLQ